MHMHIMAIINLFRNKLNIRPHRAFSVKELPWCSPKSSITKKDQWATQLKDKHPISNKTVEKRCTFQIGVIAAMDENRVIGIDGQLPWTLPEDRNHFISFTRNKTIVIGRNTYFENADLSHISHAKNVIVVSKTMNDDHLKNFTNIDNATNPSQFTSKSLEEAISLAITLHRSDPSDSNIQCWIAGGQKLYEEALRNSNTSELRLTFVHVKSDYDPRKQTVSRFPPQYRYDNDFAEVKVSERMIQSKNDGIWMSFRVFKRKVKSSLALERER
jgi:dihydrofolate reductase